MALFGSSKREGPYRYVFVEPGELREGRGSDLFGVKDV